ncbi:MAG TPA: hypothetical protein VKA12_06760 [Roseiarcus sp.]|nr:hypothetical protein [Roseiarcus sp.]
MTNVIPFQPMNKGGGDGPEDPMLEQRVARLEQILERLEPKITEILLTGAKQSDLHKVQTDLAEVKGRISGMPTTWTLFAGLVTATITTWSAGAAIVFALIKATHS